MFISRECDYAVRIVRSLSDYEIRNVNEICENEHVPKQYAYKILKKLIRSNIVQSYRGALGGFELAKSTGDIFLYDIIVAVEEDFIECDCMAEDYRCPKSNKDERCKVHEELFRVQSLLSESLQEKSLHEILSSAR
ncbi:MAG: Rrf2 family transcriptional regulator [Eubacteriaceae bacterium]|nr:Rrf2 family transcriptional regulator [Eubacteriaceae bacterium]